MNQEKINLALFLKYSKNKNDFYESDSNPMHPNLFQQLSMVIGFNKINGRTYPKYITKWEKNHNITLK